MAEIRLAGTKTSLFTLPDLEIDEFVPVVQFDPANSKSDALVTTLKGPKVELSPVIDEPLRTIETDILVAVPGKMVVTCTVAKGRKGTLDDDGVITPRLVGKVQGVTVEALNAGRARYGEAYRFTVEIVDNAERAFKVELLANDDAQDANTGEFRDVLCGCVEVRTWPDVFSKADADRLIEEMEFIAPFAKAEFPKEYSEMYCMKAAERGLSVLLGNKKDFYSVDRSHNRLNAISHVGFGANDRGSAFDSMGFVHSAFESKEYVVDKKLLNTVKNEDSYIVNLYKMVSLPQGSK